MRFADEQRCDEQRGFVPEASACRLLKAHDLIASPACSVVEAADEVTTNTPAPNQPRRTDLTGLEVAGWGWHHLSSGLDFSRFAVAWKLRSA